MGMGMGMGNGNIAHTVIIEVSRHWVLFTGLDWEAGITCCLSVVSGSQLIWDIQWHVLRQVNKEALMMRWSGSIHMELGPRALQLLEIGCERDLEVSEGAQGMFPCNNEGRA